MTAEPESLAATLSGRYTIEREIGRGGMATVFLAHDIKHQRDVALKIFDADVGAALGADRFLAEIRVTANLQHPNILPLFDSGEAAGTLFYVMPFVDGESLRARLDRDGALPLDDALRMMHTLCGALDYAHRRGIIHRDIKPENILLSDGVPIVADFGIAKAFVSGHENDRRGTSALTQVGVSVGTPAYMSPEQAMGEAGLDGRSDVYALGCLFYEMLAGQLPFSGPTAHAIIAHHLMTPAPSIRVLRELVSPVVDAAITRAMAKDAADRFATPAELAAALVAVPPVEPLPDYSQVTEAVTRSLEPIVGRRKEMADLYARLSAAQDGRGALVLIAGEPGVGKTRLTEALLLEARRRGHFCAVGHCYEMEGAPPYMPIVEQLEFAARVAPPGRFRAALGNGAAEIARVAPFLRQLFPDIAAPLDLPADQQRQFLFSRFREYIERIAAAVPLVLLFDDLHWADESTLLLVEYLAQHAPRMRLLMLGTYRDVDLDVNRPFARSLERVTRQRLAERLLLRRMPEDEVGELLAALGAPNPPASLVTAIYRETEGNPFFIEEVFQHLREEGRLLDADNQWLPDLDIEHLEVPEGVRLVIGRRLERVGEPCRAVLSAAAVIGPRFELRLLEALGEASADAILECLETSEAAGLILSQAVGRDTRYTFAHELIRQTLLSAMSLPRRQRRHQRTAEAIEKLYGGKPDTHIAELAYHLFQAGAAVETDRTTHTLLLAARQALSAGAFDEARAHVDRAFSIVETETDLRYAELLLVRAEAGRGMAAWAEAIRDFERAIPLLESVGAALAAAAAALALGDILVWAEGDQQRISSLLQRAVGLLPDARSPLRARLLARAGQATALTLDYDAGHAMIEEAVRDSAGSGDPIAISDCIAIRGALYSNLLITTRAIRDLGHACNDARAGHRQWDFARWGGLLARCHLQNGQFDQAIALAHEVHLAAEETGHIGAMVVTDMVTSFHEWYRLSSMDSFLAYAEVCKQPQVPPLFRELGASVKELISLEQDDPGEMGSQMEGSSERAGMLHWRDTLWAEEFRMKAYRNGESALAILQRYADRLPTPGQPAFGGARQAVIAVIEGLAVLDERAEAASLWPQCMDLIRDGNVVLFDSVIEWSAGIAAACGEHWAESEAHFQAALEISRRLMFPSGEAQVYRWHAWMLLSRRGEGDAELARGMLREAVAINERLGLVRRARTCREMLGSGSW